MSLLRNPVPKLPKVSVSKMFNSSLALVTAKDALQFRSGIQSLLVQEREQSIVQV
jgi:hypothetical protein